MNEARRALVGWLLSAWLGQGVARPRHHWEVARFERPLPPEELRALARSALRVRFLPHPR